MTTIDGYEMAKQGRAGPALTIAALGPSSAERSRHRAGPGRPPLGSLGLNSGHRNSSR